MATFLDLCQSVARESRTVNGVKPVTVKEQEGRLGKIVHWVAQAWTDIQNDRETWSWMQARFEGTILRGQSDWSATDMSIARFGEWKVGCDPVSGSQRMTLQDNSNGRADERSIEYVDFARFKNSYMRGAPAERVGRPSVYSVREDRRLVLWPIPDVDYILRGEYEKGPQILKSDEDVPECPTQYHDVIVWRALMSMAAHDESITQPQFWNTRYLDLLDDLARNHLPPIHFGRPFMPNSVRY